MLAAYHWTTTRNKIVTSVVYFTAFLSNSFGTYFKMGNIKKHISLAILTITYACVVSLPIAVRYSCIPKNCNFYFCKMCQKVECSSNMLLSLAFRLIESSSCVILISESKLSLEILPDDLTVPNIQVSLGMLRKKDDIMSLCGHIIMDLDAYEPHTQNEIVTKLPASHEIIFTSSNSDTIRLFPKLSRLPLSLYFVQSNNSTVMIRKRPDLMEENNLETLGLWNNANDFIGNIKIRNRLQLDFHGSNIPAVAFPYKPFSMPNYNDPSKHSGYEYEIVKVVTDSLNLQLDISPPSSGFMWGLHNKETGNYTGKPHITMTNRMQSIHNLT